MNITNRDLKTSKNVLEHICNNGLFEGGRTHYAAEKNLRRSEQELRDFDKSKEKLLDQYARKDDEDRFIYEDPDGTEVVMEEVQSAMGTSRKPIVRETGEDYLETADDDASEEEKKVINTKNQKKASRLSYTFENGNQEKYEDELEELLDETVEFRPHKIPETLLDKEPKANQIPFRHITWMFYDEEK